MTTYTLCGKDQRMPVRSETGYAYIINNNAWNYESFTGQQCIEVSDTTPGFLVTKSLAKSAVVMGYPNISRGPSPWAVKAADLMPMPLSCLPRIRSSWRTLQNPTPRSKWNTSYDAWCCSSWPGQQYRTTEVMIMLNYPGPPVGEPVTMDGEQFLVRTALRTNKTGLTWRMVQYRFRRQRASLTDFDLTPVFHDAMGRGWITPTDLLVQVCAGFELWVGGQGLATESFSVDVGDAAS